MAIPIVPCSKSKKVTCHPPVPLFTPRDITGTNKKKKEEEKKGVAAAGVQLKGVVKNVTFG